MTTALPKMSRADPNRQRAVALTAFVARHDDLGELNEPATTAQVLPRICKLEDKALKVTTQISSSAKVMQNLISDVLDFTRTRLGGGMPIEHRPMDLEVPIRDVVAEFRAGYPRATITYETDGVLQDTRRGRLLRYAATADRHRRGPAGDEQAAHPRRRQTCGHAQSCIRERASDEAGAVKSDQPITSHRTTTAIPQDHSDKRQRSPSLLQSRSKIEALFVNIPITAAGYDAKRDGPVNVVTAIETQAAILADTTKPTETRAEALKFVVHLFGNLHQPLHSGDRADKGGNACLVFMPESKAKAAENLHKIWDGVMLRQWLRGTRVVEYAAKLDGALKPADEVTMATGKPTTWANEAHDVARDVVYPGIPAGVVTRLTQNYVDAARLVTDKQLTRGDVRLAAALNRAFADRPATRPTR